MELLSTRSRVDLTTVVRHMYYRLKLKGYLSFVVLSNRQISFYLYSMMKQMHRKFFSYGPVHTYTEMLIVL
jgi:hypothetical protein